MDKVIYDNSPGKSRQESNEPFWSATAAADPAERLRELESIAASQRVKIESMEREMAETRASMEQALAYANKMTVAADNAIRAKSRFLRNVSHELRTPMNSIIGMTRLILETGLNDEQMEFAQIVQESASELMCIINDILDLSKIESDSLVICQ